jgi:hypothetical protein
MPVIAVFDNTRVTDVAYVASITVCSTSMVGSVKGVIQIIDVCVFLRAGHG